MKKFLILFLTTLVTVVANAQIFTHKVVKDKFDDVVSEREIKTLVTKNDTAFIIEEKGNKPVTYKILSEFDSTGSKDNIVRLLGNVYGYEKTWEVVLEKNIIGSLLDEYRYFITHRVVTDQFGTKLLYECYLIEKISKNGNYERIIYGRYYSH